MLPPTFRHVLDLLHTFTGGGDFRNSVVLVEESSCVHTNGKADEAHGETDLLVGDSGGKVGHMCRVGRYIGVGSGGFWGKGRTYV